MSIKKTCNKILTSVAISAAFLSIYPSTLQIKNVQANTTAEPQYAIDFVKTIAPFAVEIGKEYNLYPSIIIAQAALESGWGGQSPNLKEDYVLSLPPNYNLFGVKGNYNGASVEVVTTEYTEENGYYEATALFKKYPSYKESLLDYANKLRYNTSTSDPYIYSGTWVENTNSYLDATKALTGVWAA